MTASDLLDGFGAPTPFTLEAARSAPGQPGLHVVLDDAGEVVYVGQTKDLRRGLLEHLQGDRQASVLYEQVGQLLDRAGRSASAEEIRTWLGRCTVRWRLSDDPASRKAELVAALAPRFNRAQATPRTGVRSKRQPDPEAARWAQLVHWARRFAESMDLDAEERDYKLVIRDHIVEARDAVRRDAGEWPRTLRRAFGQPNNLTSWQMHARFLDWVEANRDDARAALLVLWDESLDSLESTDTFVSALPPDLSGSGARANLASFLLAGRGVEQLPVFRPAAFETAYRLTGFPPTADAPPATRYRDALRFLAGSPAHVGPAMCSRCATGWTRRVCCGRWCRATPHKGGAQTRSSPTSGS